MIQYLLETIAFQLVFLMVYDLFLKKETFFQWNRIYLLGTFVFSMVLPWIKIEGLKTTVKTKTLVYPEFLWQLGEVNLITNIKNESSFWDSLSTYEWIFLLGALAMTFLFLGKLYRIKDLRSKGEVCYHKGFTKITVKKSKVAFSFFKQVFLGDAIPSKQEPQILAHELVHIRQWHSLDLLFFELMRILLWFNPLVYVYQGRMAALHEFIADAEVAKNDRPAQYQVLLSEVFKTQNFSFVNQFFKKSLIKKRIVMLTKKKSKTILQLKYFLLVPVICGMLFYSSCERETSKYNIITDSMEVGDIDNLTKEEEIMAFNTLINLSVQSKNWSYAIRDKNSTITFKQGQEGSFISGPGGVPIRATMHIESEILNQDFDLFKFDSSKPIRIFTNGGPQVLVNAGVPFGMVDKVPVFPGCEDAVDTKACFMEQIQTHIRKHFNYPQEAQDLGIEGRVAVMFTIDKNGEITNVQKRGPHELLENEVERIIKRLPKIQPGKHQGKEVNVPFSIPVNFVLSDGRDINLIQSTSEDEIGVSGELVFKENTTFYKGKVTDSEGLNLPGVTISVKGKETGVISDFKGDFMIKVEKGDVLKFVYPGLKTIDMAIQ